MRLFSILLFACVSASIFAQTPTPEAINAACDRLLPSVIEWRRHIHEHPELSNREVQTAAYVEAHLRKLGLEVRTKIAKTGVVGILRGGQPGPVVGLRADMDALPVKERAALPFASKATGEYNGKTVDVMHACGHDTHVAMLMGAAEVLSNFKNALRGTVVFVFQPAEEGPPAGEEGGAALMIKEGAMDDPKIEAMFGIHISSMDEAGKILYKSGSVLASSDLFSIKIRGKQTHGANPWAGIDPITVAAQITLGLQTIVSRQEDLTKSPVIVSIGQIHAGVRDNIIPEELTMSGTIRVLDAAMRLDVQEKLRRTATNIAEASGAVAEVSITPRTPVTYNAPSLVKKMLPSLAKAVGPDHVLETEWATNAEDFACYGERVPAFFFSVGGRPANVSEKEAAPHHTPDFFIDDSRLDAGVKAFCHIVFDYPN